MVLYFTGTGNSRYIAKRMKEKTSDDMICINDRIKRNQRSQLLTTLVSFWLPISNLTYISGMQLHFLRLYLILLQMHHG